MSTIFMNLRNSKASDAHKLRLNLTDKIDLQRGCNSATLSNIMMDLIPYQKFRTISNTSSRNMKHLLINHQLKHM